MKVQLTKDPLMTKANDQLPFVTPRAAVQAAYGALSAIQGERPGVQLAAATVLFRVLADELRLDISQLLDQGRRLINDDDTAFRYEVAAFREYVKGELK